MAYVLFWYIVFLSEEGYTLTFYTVAQQCFPVLVALLTLTDYTISPSPLIALSTAT